MGLAANMDLLLRRALRRERGAACLEEQHEKKLLLAPLMAVLVACVVLLSGCGGPSVEELITKDLTTQFDEVKNGGDDFLSGLEEASGDEFEQLGIDPKEYAKSYLEGLITRSVM